MNGPARPSPGLEEELEDALPFAGGLLVLPLGDVVGVEGVVAVVEDPDFLFCFGSGGKDMKKTQNDAN